MSAEFPLREAVDHLMQSQCTTLRLECDPSARRKLAKFAMWASFTPRAQGAGDRASASRFAWPSTYLFNPG
jgi:hypothetical protein